MPLADAVLSPVLGKLAFRLRSIMEDDDAANPSGSAYFGGWYSYVVKDLRSLLGKPVAGARETRFCGAALWGALDAAAADLAAAQGGSPAAWRSDATRERNSFGFLRKTMRWTNRPTFQQVISFNAHRPR